MGEGRDFAFQEFNKQKVNEMNFPLRFFSEPTSSKQRCIASRLLVFKIKAQGVKVSLGESFFSLKNL